MNKLTAEDFEVWLASAVTREIHDLLDQGIADCNAAWMSALRDPRLTAQDTQLLKVELQARAETLRQVRNLTYKDIADEPTNVTDIRRASA